MTRRLFLVGDDEVLDAVADLSRHLDYYQVARLDGCPEEPLGADDHVLLAFQDDTVGRRELGALLTRPSPPGHAALVAAPPGASAGARAILAAAGLVAALYPTAAG
jgi:hypothetical protein